jgi:hypothetical protein
MSMATQSPEKIENNKTRRLPNLKSSGSLPKFVPKEQKVTESPLKGMSY